MKSLFSVLTALVLLSPVSGYADGQHRGGDEMPKAGKEVSCVSGGDRVYFTHAELRSPRLQILTYKGLDYYNGTCRRIPGADEYAITCTLGSNGVTSFEVDLVSHGSPQLFATIRPTDGSEPKTIACDNKE